MSRRWWVLLAVTLLLAAQLPMAAGVSAQSGRLRAKLTGSHEVPANPSPATGNAQVTILGNGTQVYYQYFVTNLTGPPTMAHIHLGAIGVNGPILLPLSVPATATGFASGLLTAADFTGAGNLTFEQALAAIEAGGTYVNVHTEKYPSGEVRGQVFDPIAALDYTITADWAAGVPQGEIWGFNDYFPNSISVPRGSTLHFEIQGFHTVTLLPAGMTANQSFAANGIVVPDDPPEETANGTTGVIQNFGIFADVLPSPGCGGDGNPCYFDGTRWLSIAPPSGPDAPPPPAVYVAAAPGTYVIHCLIHPAMVGTLNVVSTPLDPAAWTPDDVVASVAAQTGRLGADAAQANRAVERVSLSTSASGVRTWNAWAGYEIGAAAVVEFPKTIRIRSGDRVRWVMQGRNEPHTVTFPESLGQGTVIVCETGDSEVPATPGQDPADPTGYTCPGGGDLQFEVGGGNGVSRLTSPATQSDSGTIASAAFLQLSGLPLTAALRSWTVSFAGAAPGTYTYLCEIHGDAMSGKIIVSK
jgi:plastocyanin